MDIRIPYAVIGPYMDMSVPSWTLKAGRYGYLAGVDGRYGGSLRKFYGMKYVRDISGGSMSNIRMFRYVVFQKGESRYQYRGFVVRYGASGTVKLIYRDTESKTWSSKTIWGSTSSASVVGCDTGGKFLYVACSGKVPQVLFCKNDSLVQVDMGAGSFSVESGMKAMEDKLTSSTWKLGFTHSGNDFDDAEITEGDTVTGPGGTLVVERVELTGGSWEEENATGYLYSTRKSGAFSPGQGLSVSSKGLTNIVKTTDSGSGDYGYWLNGSGSYRVAFRFYDSVRGVYSALSPEITVRLSMNDDRKAYSALVQLPQSQAGFSYSEFEEMFDTLEVFRTLDVSAYDAFDGAIFYRERTIEKSGNWDSLGKWNSLTVKIGSLRDESLVTQTKYDPEYDVSMCPPEGGAVGSWENLTFISGSPDVRGGVDTYYSDPGVLCGEYFTGKYIYRAAPQDGYPLRYVVAGNLLFICSRHSITIAEKRGEKLEFTRQHIGRGLLNQEAVHTIGNDLILATPIGIGIVTSEDLKLQVFSTLSRLFAEEWAEDAAYLSSGYDSRGAVSFFLNSRSGDIVCIWWMSKAVSILEKTGFNACTCGPDVSGETDDVKAYFITPTGVVVTPDWGQEGCGTMFGLSGAANVEADINTDGSVIISTDGGWSANCNGAYVYKTSGNGAGDAVRIDGVVYESVTVSGELTPDATGSYSYAGISGGKPYWQGEEYRLWYEPASARWVISAEVPADEGERWISPVASCPYGLTFTPAEGSGASGNATCQANTASSPIGVFMAGTFTGGVDAGSTYAVSPVAFRVRMWNITASSSGQSEGLDDSTRKILTGMTLKVRRCSGFGAVNNKFRTGAYREGKETLETGELATAEITVSENPSECTCSLRIDGTDIEPYIEQLSCGTNFELTNIDVFATITDSRKIK